MIIREGNANDIDQVFEIVKKVAGEGQYLGAGPENITNEFFIKGLEQPEKYILTVAEEEGKIVGYADAKRRNTTIQKHVFGMGIMLLPEHRGKKIGTRLLEKLIEECKKKEGRIIIVDVYETNKGALKLYENHGFERIGTIKGEGFLKGKYVDLILMVKYL